MGVIRRCAQSWTTFDIQPTIAYRIFDRLSFGASLDIQYASARLTQAIDFGLAAQPLLGTFYANVRGSSARCHAVGLRECRLSAGRTLRRFRSDRRRLELGYTLGALLEYGRVARTVSFRRAISAPASAPESMHVLEGRGDFRRVPVITAPGAPAQFPVPNALQNVFFAQDASAKLDLPEIVRLGVYQRFAQRFAIMGDVTWTHWKSFADGAHRVLKSRHAGQRPAD